MTSTIAFKIYKDFRFFCTVRSERWSLRFVFSWFAKKKKNKGWIWCCQLSSWCKGQL